MSTRCLAIVLSSLLATGGCGGSKSSVLQSEQVPPRAITKLAIAPGSGVLGDAVGVELFNRGLTIIDPQEAIAIIGRVGLSEFEVTSTNGFKALQEKGIDAVLGVKSVDALDGTPESASVRVTDTATGQIIAGITWQNGNKGLGLIYLLTRKNLHQAANDIAGKLAKRLQSDQ